jgi:hypothetical protein
MSERVTQRARVCYAPNLPPPRRPWIYLGGAFTDWRPWVVERLADLDLTFLDPSREPWPEKPWSDLLDEQIVWEHAQLALCELSVWWFDASVVSPIGLFQLGHQLGQRRPVIVGASTQYRRREELVRLLDTLRWGVGVQSRVHDNIGDFVGAVREALPTCQPA